MATTNRADWLAWIKKQIPKAHAITAFPASAEWREIETRLIDLLAQSPVLTDEELRAAAVAISQDANILTEAHTIRSQEPPRPKRIN
jgi:hypothetical protein